MSFLKRFGYYLAGLSIGLLFLAFFLRKKADETGVEFCYLPNCRVLKALRSNPLEVAERLRAVADTATVAYLLEEGDVEFDSSDPRAEPCGIFVVTGTYVEEQLQLTLERCDSLTRLTQYQRLTEE
ncbi:hypothetical protein [Robiginitalea biformata]|uniref:DUF4258 domain-containing protein n=1 Tax=Robiginitalea biformata (strain ATCC BAA-864 / DSM 15991 / KCTC 12146 / HTCC2501) TaxID=313596 RepID=A4CLE8_ROBBH|nr:hypothetical protein [Robiginitalea biformata]EAR15697.1 hypothetical protein RB2501_15254 [Robiginitalea biformata HTCC2501]